MNINTITTDNLRHMEGKDGLILQGCGGDLKEWVDGINEMFTEAGILNINTITTDNLRRGFEGMGGRDQ